MLKNKLLRNLVVILLSLLMVILIANINQVILINLKDVNMAKFNYQIVFSNCGFAETIVNAGETEFSAEKILSICTTEVSKITSSDCKVVSFIYQPINSKQDESQKVK